MMWPFKKGNKTVHPQVVEAQPTLSETARDSAREIRELMEAPPRVPDDVQKMASWASGMKASLFYWFDVQMAVAKAYKRGYENGKDHLIAKSVAEAPNETKQPPVN